MDKIIGITMGDFAGIGPEISLKAVEQDDYKNNTVIFGSKSIIEYYINVLKIKTNLNVINDIKDFKADSINLFNVVDIDFNESMIGKVSSSAGDAAYKYIEKAIEFSLKGDIGPVVTAPLNKEALHKGGHNFDGHTEIFAYLTNTEKYTMMLWSEKLSVVHVSTHVPLRKACDLATKERVMECVDLAEDAMKKLGVEEPKVAVAGLNPHSGETGLFGNEEINEVEPAVKEKLEEGKNVSGPVPPDTVFLKATQGKFDIVVAMYHDQGHIPMKLMAFDKGVNVTLGLPIIRTSVDHGTAFDIAGQGIASDVSMISAMELGFRFGKHME
ncbi:MAG: 4-hydroxythreonine-4-phosphate dehydrogenase PdxA [Tetragenococcus koreensis]|nr:4-hydroxythreonine-4-phosphate dehydrogenase PdxA [Tetragenococcus koreensis]MDN6748912.1 4-hydroxythreonine-4-phosphate dehydrogenase PdxA [Staphylococcus equorum]MDN6166390.1 4-hydroxythreonine-4-phosphate dehydrogenase PdxA [Tetragenococcus koreensis]MDN6266639.1 4-hydroxythreonine-4-phosphate dehydrogenase PdxA [Tetragenococcus koreensis]MDN6579671.1 4-hydroxythreonine-4-phosphate dehydrogenase PdxA [Tetragenococcus koreensis]